MEKPLNFSIQNGVLTLGSQELRFVEYYKLVMDSEMRDGSELTLKILVNAFDNMPLRKE